MQGLTALLVSHENDIVSGVIEYARAHGYARYMPVEESYRRAVDMILTGMAEALEGGRIVEPSADEQVPSDPGSQVGHRIHEMLTRSGMDPLPVFGMLKYYRRSFADVVRNARLDLVTETHYLTAIARYFDRVELGYIAPWSEVTKEDLGEALRERNRELLAEKTRYYSALQHLPVSVFLMDAEGKVEIMNEAAAALFQPHDVARPILGRGAQTREDPPVLRQEIGAFFASPDRERALEAALKTAKGPRHFQVRLSKLFTVEGSYTAMLVILTDVTYRRRAEDALRSSQAKYQALFENMVAPMTYFRVILDSRNRPSDLEIVEVNRVASVLAEKPVSELVGKRLIADRVGPEGYAEMVVARAGRVAITGEEDSFEVVAPSLGRPVHVTAYCSQPGYVAVLMMGEG
jgi:PAS domain-containing protein